MKISVVYSTDENYVRYCATSILSLLENSTDIGKIYIIDNKIKIESKKKLNDMIRNTDFYRLILNIYLAYVGCIWPFVFRGLLHVFPESIEYIIVLGMVT